MIYDIDGTVISEGSTIMVVRPMPCCGTEKDIGAVHKVLKILKTISYCDICNRLFEVKDLPWIGSNEVIFHQ